MIRKAVLGRAAVWVTAGVIGVAGLTAAGVSYASSPGSTTTAAAATSTGRAHQRARSLARRAVHGEFTVRTPQKNGGYTTYDTQRGEFTAVGPTSVTLKSSDGFTRTYVVTGATTVTAEGKDSAIADVRVGDTGNVVATTAGGTRTAVRIGDPGA